MIPNRLLLLIFLIIFNVISVAQFKISQLSSNFDELQDSLFLGTTSTRTIQNLNDDWKAFLADSPENFTKVSFPLSFNSKQTIIFEKNFEIKSNRIINDFITLNFLGINYIAEIFLNNANIYKHSGGKIPFSINLPQNLINYEAKNTLRIKIQYNIDSRNTIPLLQRFLFPINEGGILRDVYISYKPRVGIKNISYTVNVK